MTSQVRNTATQISRVELPTPFPVGPVNAYLVRDSTEVVLIDCGPRTEEARDALLRGLETEGVRPEDLTALILTHGHVDHVGQAAWLQSLGVPVYAPPHVDTWLEPEGKWVNYRHDFFKALYKAQGVPDAEIEKAHRDLRFLNQFQGTASVDAVLEYGARCPVLPQFEVLHVPGHAQHALALWNPSSGALIVGDQLLPHISSNALVEPELSAKSGDLAVRTKSLIQYQENLKFLQSLEVSTVYPGHGGEFHNAHDLIKRRLTSQANRRDEFLTRFKTKEWLSTFELAVEYFPRHRHQTSLIMSETLGYLDWLCDLGVIEEVEAQQEGLLCWKKAE